MNRRPVLVVPLSIAFCLLAASPAVADPVVVDGGEGRVKTGIQTPATPGGAAPVGVGAGAGDSVVPARGETAANPCSYRPLTPEQALAAGLLSPDDGGAENLWDTGGAYMLRDCRAAGGNRQVLWVPDNEGGTAGPPGVPAVTPDVLAQEARNTLQLPEPTVGVSPDGLNENPALVNLPTWWWVTNGDPLTQRTSLGGVWAEVTAEATSSAWVTSDGERTDCAGLGMAWAQGMRELEPGSCSHTYTHANADEEAQIEVVWQVSWVGSGGTGGTLDPITLTSTLAVPVYERHAIVTSVG